MHESDPATDPLGQFAEQLEAAEQRDLMEPLSFWKKYVVGGSEAPEGFVKLGEMFLEADEHLIAHDVIQAGVDLHPHHVRLRQLHALALIHTGAVQLANSALTHLRREGVRDTRTLGMLGRTYKDLADQATTLEERQVLLTKSYDRYYEAYNVTGEYWPAINAATMALLCGRMDDARELAARVREQCIPEAQAPDTAKSYWPLAARGEAALILGEQAEAEDAYARAGLVAGDRYSYLQASRRNARLLVGHLKGDDSFIDRCLAVPAVVVFAGHMIDRPERPSRRFPTWLEKDVSAALRERLKAIRVGFAFCSVACGSDILFAESVLESGGKVHIVIPHDREKFIEESVDFIPDSDWKRRANGVLERAIHVTIASEHSSTREGKQYEYSNEVLQGLAMLRARYFDQSAMGFAVWDGKPGDGSGGTAWTINRWRQSGLSVQTLDLSQILHQHTHGRPQQSEAVRGRPVTVRRCRKSFSPEIRGLLFADAAGFSKLSEDQVILFVRHYLKLVAKIANQFKRARLLSNTWGDGLYFVMEDVKSTGLLALELCEQVAKTDWKTKGLSPLSLRIGVHAGPVYACTDPVTSNQNFIGAHVSRAARIEPIAPTGGVFASEQFAALAAVEGVREFTCDYFGQAKMAKGYGIFPTYMIRRCCPNLYIQPDHAHKSAILAAGSA